MRRTLGAVLLVLSLLTTQRGVAQVPGAYEFEICDTACDVEGRLLLSRGVFVLLDASLDSVELAAVPRRRRLIGVGGRDPANACFVFESSVRQFRGEEFYPGIVEAAVSSWSEDQYGVVVQLYRSPDAGYIAELSEGEEVLALVGKGRQRNWDRTERRPWGWILARRVGSASLDHCFP